MNAPHPARTCRIPRIPAVLALALFCASLFALPAQAAYREMDVQSTMSGSRLVNTDKAGKGRAGRAKKRSGHQAAQRFVFRFRVEPGNAAIILPFARIRAFNE